MRADNLVAFIFGIIFLSAIYPRIYKRSKSRFLKFVKFVFANPLPSIFIAVAFFQVSLFQ